MAFSQAMTGAIQSSSNFLLASLAAEDLERIGSSLTAVSLEKGALLYDPGDEVDAVYFPHNCVISLMTQLCGK